MGSRSNGRSPDWQGLKRERGYWCCATSGSHSKGFSSLPTHTHTHTHTHTFVQIRKQTQIKCMVTTRTHTTFTWDSSRHASVIDKLCQTDIMYFPVASSQRPARPERWSPCLRLILRFVANYFMRPLNCLLKSNYQAVCVAYKIGAETRGG